MASYVVIYDSRRWVRSDSTDTTAVLPVTAGGTGNTTGTATVNANLTGPITSVGNATSVASQTGTGATFVMQASPTINTPTVSGDLTFTGGGNSRLQNGAQLQARNAANTFHSRLISNDASDRIVIGDTTTSISNEFRVHTDGSATPTLKVSTSGIVTIVAPIILKGYTVATLPAGTVGMRAYVTDALGPAYGAVVVGGGAVVVPVFFNGAAWVTA